MATKRKYDDSDSISLPENVNFLVRITQPGTFRTMIENIHTVVTDVQIAIVKNESFEGLKVETLDDNSVCMVIAQMPCEVIVDKSWADKCNIICLSADILINILKHVDCQYTLTLSQRSDDVQLILHASSETQTDTTTTRINTKHFEVSRPKALATMVSKFTIEMKLDEFRETLKLCSSIGAEDIKFIVREIKNEDDSFDILSLEGDGVQGSIVKRFRGMKTGDDGTLSWISPSSEMDLDDNNGKIVFEESYSASYLNKFTRAMHRTIVRVKLTPDKPIYVEYPLGGREADLLYILAPKVK